MAKASSKKAVLKGQALDAEMADFLIGAAKPSSPKGKKDSVPVVEGHEQLSDEAFSAYREMKDAEAAFRLVEGKVLEVTDAEYARRAKAGDFTKSMDLPGTNTPGIQLTYQDKFSALAIEQEGGLRGALGEDYDAYFEQKRVLTIKEECTDTPHIKLLRERLGDEMFLAFFDIKVTVVAKNDMDRKQFELPDGLATLSGLKQAKGSLKIRKAE